VTLKGLGDVFPVRLPLRKPVFTSEASKQQIILYTTNRRQWEKNLTK